MNRFKKFVQKMILIFTSREFAFLFVLMGVIGQVMHTYYLTYHISSLEDNTKIFQAVIISAFISVSLLYFVSISSEIEKGMSYLERKKIKQQHNAVNLFMAIEIIINLYYYSRYLILENIDKGITIHNWFDFVFGIVIAVMIPVTIKLYASHIRAKEWLMDGNINENKTNIVNKDEIVNEIVEQVSDKITEFDEKLENKLTEVDADIKNSFEKHSSLFVEQYKNKLKTINKTS